MKPFLLTLLLCLFIPAHVAEAFPLWLAEAGERRVHILATIPVVSTDTLFRVPQAGRDAFEAATLVILDADPDPARRGEIMERAAEAAMYPEDRNLLDELPPARRRRVQQALEDLNIRNPTILRWHPWMAARQILNIASVRAGMQRTQSFELNYYRASQQRGKDVVFLASPAESVGLYQAMSDTLQQDLLEKTLKDAATIGPFLQALDTAWRAGDLDAASRRMNASFAGRDELRRALFSARNADWATRIAAWSEEHEDTFVAISLSHLIGPDNLLDALGRKGFTIRRSADTPTY